MSNHEIEIQINEITLLKTTHYAFLDYIKTVKGNSNLRRLAVEKKLTRNVMLSIPHEVPNTNNVWYHFGAMRILVENGNIITRVLNNQLVDRTWVYDRGLKKLLDKKLEIA